MSSHRYAATVGWRIGLFVLLTVGLPWALALAGRDGRCGRGSLCEDGMLFVMFGMFLWPVLVLALALALTRPTVRRSRAVGLR